jgi:hypothetical protein
MTAWVSLTDIKAQLAKLQFDYSLWSDDQIMGSLQLQQNWIERQMRRKLELQQFDDYYDGNGKERLVLDQYPVTEITALQIVGPNESLNELVDVGTLLVDKARGVLTYTTWALPYNFFPEGCKNINVKYKAGYDPLPIEIIDATMKCVCLDMIAGTPARTDIDGLKSVRVLNYSASYTGAYSNLFAIWNEQIQDVINGFRRTIIF